MSPLIILFIILGYFALLMLVSHFTSRSANNQSFFVGNRQSPWYIVAIGMIGASLSGVTFISVPGWVQDNHFYYMQMVLGYLVGYAVIIYILLPVYYRMKLTSIYSYLDERFGIVSYKTGASLFLISRLLGASLRLFLVANVLQLVVFDYLNIPFIITVIITLALIWVYTFRGGIKTIVWTDTLQTVFMLLAVGLAFVMLSREMNLNFRGVYNTIAQSEYSAIFDFNDWHSDKYFWKYFLSGAFITIVMTGLDQDMMQKNLSCRNLKDAQKNMLTYSLAFVPVNLIFLSLGALLFIYAQANGIILPERSDEVFAFIAMNGYLPAIVGVFFILGLIAAAYSSADSALTSLTTSYLVDIVGIKNLSETEIRRKRIRIHLVMSAIIAIIILMFRAFNNESVISALFKVAGYTYGPLLGMYAYGFISKRKVRDYLTPVIAIVSPLILFVLNHYSEKLWGEYKMGFEVLIYNGMLTLFAMYLISKREK